jgi:RimJ/RimL family protein N-acetyltransferase
MTGMDDEVRLRDPVPADLEIFFAQEHDPEAARRANFTPRDHAAFMDHWTYAILGDDTVGVQTVVVGDAVAGNVVSWWQNGLRTVGYWLGREFWGRGVGTAALLQYLGRETVRPLYADADIGNTASIRLLERCGFVHLKTVKTDAAEFVVLRLQ